MSDLTVKRIDEMEAVLGGGFKRARASLGVESFGMSILDLPPNFDRYPEHDEARSGQEEVYIALQGSGELDVEGERIALDEETFVRVGAGTKRKVHVGPDGVRLLVLGATPGKVYEPSESSKLGAPEPGV